MLNRSVITNSHTAQYVNRIFLGLISDIAPIFTERTKDRHKESQLYFLFTFMGPCIVNVFFKYNQQDATLYNILHVSGGFSSHRQELKNCEHSIH